MAKDNKSDAKKFLEEVAGGSLTFGRAIESVSKCDEVTQDAYAKRLGISKSHLCNIEKGRKTVSPEGAAKWANILGYPQRQRPKRARRCRLRLQQRQLRNRERRPPTVVPAITRGQDL